MNTNKILEYAKDKGGRFVRVAWKSKLPLLKKVENQNLKIEKTVVMVGQLKVSYENRIAVKESRENGTLPSEPQGLNGMEWVVYPLIKRSIKTNKEYLVITPCNNIASKVVFSMEEKEIDRNVLDGIVPSEKWKVSEKSKTDVVNIPIEDIYELI